MTLEQLKQLHAAYIEADKHNREISKRGSGSSIEDAGMALFEARTAYETAFNNAGEELQAQMRQHLQGVAA